MTRPENFMNPAGNVMKEIKEADLNNFSAGAGEPRVSDGSQFCTSTKECNWVLFGKLNAAVSIRLKRVFQST